MYKIKVIYLGSKVNRLGTLDIVSVNLLIYNETQKKLMFRILIHYIDNILCSLDNITVFIFILSHYWCQNQKRNNEKVFQNLLFAYIVIGI